MNGKDTRKTETTAWFLRNPKEWGILQIVILTVCVGLLGIDKVLHFFNGEDSSGKMKPITSAEMKAIVGTEIQSHTSEIKLYIQNLINASVEKHEASGVHRGAETTRTHDRDIENLRREIDYLKRKNLQP